MWYGSDAPRETMDYPTLQANVATIEDCLHENPYNKSNCVGVTKSYCHVEQPTCNLQEAAAWNTLASRKRSTQYTWLRHDQQSCAYHARTEGFTINQPDAWAPNLAPSGCVLQRSAHRFFQMSTHKHGKKHVRTRKMTAASPAPAPLAPAPLAPAPMAPAPMAPAPMAHAPMAAAPAPMNPAPTSMPSPAVPLPAPAPAPLAAPAASAPTLAPALPSVPSPAAAPAATH